MSDFRDPFAGALIQESPLAAPGQEPDRRLPLTPLDEQRLAAVALWCKIIGIVTLASAGLTGLLEGYVLFSAARLSILKLVATVVVLIINLLLARFLLQASLPLRAVATDDTADKQNLLEGCQALTRYFNLLGVMLIFAVAWLLVVTIPVLLIVAR